jgi:hypothetical protein
MGLAFSVHKMGTGRKGGPPIGICKLQFIQIPIFGKLSLENAAPPKSKY